MVALTCLSCAALTQRCRDFASCRKSSYTLFRASACLPARSPSLQLHARNFRG
jgi:hypothetical protein